MPEEVVEIIKEYRTEKKNYIRLSDSATGKEIQRKLDEVKEIFVISSNEMEWEKINTEVIEKLKSELKIEELEHFSR